jgi:hypothetical protein
MQNNSNVGESFPARKSRAGESSPACEAGDLTYCRFSVVSKCAFCGMFLCDKHAKTHSCGGVEFLHPPECKCGCDGGSS